MAEEGSLQGKRYAILADTHFEQAELVKPREALEKAHATAEVVSPQKGEIQGMQHFDPGDKVKVDVELDRANPEDYDGLVLPGGVANPDALRMNPHAVAFVRHFVTSHKPIAVICHGPWTLIDADGVSGRTMTSWPSLKTDLKNAGAKWVDQEVVVEPGLVSSRKPADLPAFCREMLKMFADAPRRRIAEQHASA